ncbi:MAG: sel1 repeat family protein [Planctomycetes bacterium]|nr:sel1 repeat family protein [Planctomycetota bacterium]
MHRTKTLASSVTPLARLAAALLAVVTAGCASNGTPPAELLELPNLDRSALPAYSEPAVTEPHARLHLWSSAPLTASGPFEMVINSQRHPIDLEKLFTLGRESIRLRPGDCEILLVHRAARGKAEAGRDYVLYYDHKASETQLRDLQMGLIHKEREFVCTDCGPYDANTAELAQSKGQPAALASMGIAHFVVGRIDEGVAMMKSAAEKGSPLGHYAYGVVLILGKGVERDLAEATRQLQSAAGQGQKQAQEILPHLGWG